MRNLELNCQAYFLLRLKMLYIFKYKIIYKFSILNYQAFLLTNKNVIIYKINRKKNIKVKIFKWLSR